MKLKLVKTVKDLDELRKILMSLDIYAFDTETTGLNWWKTKIFMMSFSDGVMAWVIKCDNFEHTRLMKFMQHVVCGDTKHIIGHNIKFDMHQVKSTFGVDILRQLHDTKVMAHLLDENRNNSLKELMRVDLNLDTGEETGILDWLKKKFKKKSEYRYDAVPTELMVPYSGADAWGTYKLWRQYYFRVTEYFKELYEREMKVLRILYKMEQNGMPIDVEYFKELNYKYGLEVTHLENGLEYTSKINIQSPIQLGNYLVDTLNIPLTEVSPKSGNIKVSTDALQVIDHPFVKNLLKYRKKKKLLSTYINPFIDFNDNGVIHGNYSIARVETGRFSCSRPNLQNIPKNDEIRRGFITNENEEMWFWDQSQIEMVGFAHYSGEDSMLELFKRGTDIYTETASKVLGKDAEEVSKRERQIFKAMNLAMIYGVGSKKLGTYLNLNLEEKVNAEQAAQIRERYLETFPGIKRFMYKVMDMVKQTRPPWGHFVRNEFGRVRRIDPEKAYTGVNHLIQGFAADLMKKAMVEIEEKLHPNWKQQIHDAIRLDLPIDKQQKSEYIDEVTNIVTKVHTLRVPVRAKVEWSNTTWAEVKPYEKTASLVSVK